MGTSCTYSGIIVEVSIIWPMERRLSFIRHPEKDFLVLCVVRCWFTGFRWCWGRFYCGDEFKPGNVLE